jgi:hypothetical protein
VDCCALFLAAARTRVIDTSPAAFALMVENAHSPSEGQPSEKTSSGSICVPRFPWPRGDNSQVVLAVQLHSMKKCIALGVVAFAGLGYIHHYASARLEAMPKNPRGGPAEINAQHQLELKSETTLQ